MPAIQHIPDRRSPADNSEMRLSWNRGPQAVPACPVCASSTGASPALTPCQPRPNDRIPSPLRPPISQYFPPSACSPRCLILHGSFYNMDTGSVHSQAGTRSFSSISAPLCSTWLPSASSLSLCCFHLCGARSTVPPASDGHPTTTPMPGHPSFHNGQTLTTSKGTSSEMCINCPMSLLIRSLTHSLTPYMHTSAKSRLEYGVSVSGRGR
jgi:hypothetical protein